MTFTQWAEAAGAFTPVGNTSPSIDPGYYDTAFNDNGQILFLPVRSRDDSLMQFPDSASLAVLKGISEFWDREEIFSRYGLPYKRGIMLFGPPGSGKTCTLELVSREVVGRGGIVLTYEHPQVFLAAYRALRDIQPDVPIVTLMEDFEDLANGSQSSRLLNLLDGVEKLHKVVFLATTNYPERLDPRIINRPSRFDIRIGIGHPSEQTRRVYLESLLLEGDELDVEKYVGDTTGMSLAHVKELFVATHILGADYVETVTRLDDMQTKNPSSTDVIDESATIAKLVFGGRYL